MTRTIPVFSAQTVNQVLDMATCIELMADTAMAISRGDITIPLRTRVALAGGRNSLLLMPGETQQVFGAKLLSLYPANAQQNLPVIQGQILLFESRSGTPAALVDAAAVTAIRTAAASAAATRVLANEQATVLALLGYGVQAASHLQAMCAVRPVERVYVWGPDLQRAAAFARANARPGLQVAAAASPAEAVRNADLICAVSAASEPIIEATWLKPGVHINLVGAHTAVTREADADTLAKAQVYTEIDEFARVESGNLLLAVASGHMSLDDVCGEIGELLLGRISGRASPTSRTVYLSLGNTAQDLAAAAYVVDHADGVP